MMRESEDSLLVYMGPAQTMPGLVFGLVHPDGQGSRVFLLDSFLEAAVYAEHFGAKLTTVMPEVRDPRQAIDTTADYGSVGKRKFTHREEIDLR